jgi:hypothetical protein
MGGMSRSSRNLFLVLAVLGCFLVVGGAVGWLMWPHYTTTVIGPLPPNGARLKVLHAADLGLLRGSSSAGNVYQYQAEFGKFKLQTQGATLKINDHDFGKLEAGADVVVDARSEDIKVTVNGVERISNWRVEQ